MADEAPAETAKVAKTRAVTHHRTRPAERQWLRALIFTLVLVGLVSVAAGEEWQFDIAALLVSAVGFGFFYVLFAGGMHFGITVANILALYASVFSFLRDANFHGAPRIPSIIALALPVIAFLGACFVQRRTIAAIIRARRSRELTRMPRLSRWVPAVALVGVVSFALPRLYLAPETLGPILVCAMAVVSLIVALSVRDVVLLLLDVAIIFENVTARIDRLVMPMLAFLTIYSLLVVVFACVFRIADMSAGKPQFAVHGLPRFLTFGESLYFSVITLSTVGYGDIVPDGALVRVLATAEVVAGLLLLLFGFSEITRVGNDSRAPRGPQAPPG